MKHIKMYIEILFIESSSLFNNTYRRIQKIFQVSLGGSQNDLDNVKPNDVAIDPQKSNGTKDQTPLAPIMSGTTKESRIESIALNTEDIEFAFRCHPKVQRILSEKMYREYSQCNIILTINELQAQCDVNHSKTKMNDKAWPILRRTSSV